jgi:hypothetical protein
MTRKKCESPLLVLSTAVLVLVLDAGAVGWDGLARRFEHETTSRKNNPVNFELRRS